jgi:hypothetical protein
MDTVDALLRVIASAVADVKAIYGQEGTAFPSLDDVYEPTVADDKSAKARELVVAAAMHLAAAMRSPLPFLSDAMVGVRLTSPLFLVTILRI